MSGKAQVTVGAIGHRGHGKTRLLAALTRTAADLVGVDTWPDPPPEDPGRGTLRNRVYRYETPSSEVIHVDCPGWRGGLRQVARAAPLFDVALLVVAADEGVQAQTREHLYVARQGGARAAVVFINKCDRMTDLDLLDVTELEVREVLGEAGFDPDETPIVRGAAEAADFAPWQESMHTLLDLLDGGTLPTESSLVRSPVLLIDTKYNTRVPEARVVAGRILRGVLKQGDIVDRVGLGPRVPLEVVSLQRARIAVPEVGPGDNLGVALRGPGVDGLCVGQALVPPDAGWVAPNFIARIEFLAPEEGGRHTPAFAGYRPAFFVGTACVTGRVMFDGPAMEPGEAREVRVHLEHPVYLEPGLSFSVRDGCDGFARGRRPPTWAGTAAVGVVQGPLGSMSEADLTRLRRRGA